MLFLPQPASIVWKQVNKLPLKKKYPGLIPEVRILFMDESDNGSVNEINAFLNSLAKYNYKVLSIEDFVPIFWRYRDFSRCIVLV